MTESPKIINKSPKDATKTPTNHQKNKNCPKIIKFQSENHKKSKTKTNIPYNMPKWDLHVFIGFTPLGPNKKPKHRLRL